VADAVPRLNAAARRHYTIDAEVRPRWDGHRVLGPRPQARIARRAQAVASRACGRGSDGERFCARSSSRHNSSTRHIRHSSIQGGGRVPLLRDALRPGRELRRAWSGKASCRSTKRSAYPRDRLGPRLRARRGGHPSRYQARECHAPPGASRWWQTSGSRWREHGGPGAAHRDGLSLGTPAYMSPEQTSASPSSRPKRPVQPGVRAVRDAGWGAALHRSDREAIMPNA